MFENPRRCSRSSAPLAQIEGFPPNCRHCMWDQVDRDVMMASGGKELHTYVHSHTTIRGSMVRLSTCHQIGPLAR